MRRVATTTITCDRPGCPSETRYQGTGYRGLDALPTTWFYVVRLVWGPYTLEEVEFCSRACLLAAIELQEQRPCLR